MPCSSCTAGVRCFQPEVGLRSADRISLVFVHLLQLLQPPVVYLVQSSLSNGRCKQETDQYHVMQNTEYTEKRLASKHVSGNYLSELVLQKKNEVSYKVQFSTAALKCPSLAE